MLISIILVSITIYIYPLSVAILIPLVELVYRIIVRHLTNGGRGNDPGLFLNFNMQFGAFCGAFW